jgi:hypothetical protein
VLGAVFAVLVAPHVFAVAVEYPVFLCLAYLVTRSADVAKRTRFAPIFTALGIALIIGAAVAGVSTGRIDEQAAITSAPAIALIAVMLLAANRRSPMTLLLTSFLGAFMLAVQGPILHGERTFFGTLRVLEVDGGTQRALFHGTTDHGRQRPGADARIPLTYFARSGPIGDVFALRGARADEVGVIGLGVGTLAAYGRPGQRFTFFELDPAVVAVASNPRYFTYLKDSRADVRVVVGDGRLRTERTPDGTFEIFVVDAFSSDMIPTHLVTREALELYARKVTADGLIAFNVSSRWFDLTPVVAASAADLGLIAVERRDAEFGKGAERGKHPSIWVVVARSRSAVAPLLASGRWHLARGGSGWTDDFSNPLRALIW